MGGILDPEIGDTECGILLNSLVCASIDQDAQELCAANNSAIYYSLDAYDNDPEIATEMVDPHAAVIDSVQTANNNVIYYSLDACDNVVTMETFQMPIDRSYTRELYAETDSVSTADVQVAAVRVEEQVTQVTASATRSASCRRAPPRGKTRAGAPRGAPCPFKTKQLQQQPQQSQQIPYLAGLRALWHGLASAQVSKSTAARRPCWCPQQELSVRLGASRRERGSAAPSGRTRRSSWHG